jgi:hypothetical protein
MCLLTKRKMRMSGYITPEIASKSAAILAGAIGHLYLIAF